jgi:hypothetical protein
MTSDVKAALDAWRRAEQHAREIEALFDSAFTEYTQKRGPEVSPELMRLVSQSRHRANALLTEALSSLKSQVK